MASKEGAKGKWKKGQRVEVHGLQGAAHLNGCQGAVLEWLKAKTRRVTPSPHSAAALPELPSCCAPLLPSTPTLKMPLELSDLRPLRLLPPRRTWHTG